MKKLLTTLALPGVLLWILGCGEKTDTLSAGQDWAHITGIVKYAEDLTPVNLAFVRTQNHLETAMTDTGGHYDLAIALPKGAQESVTLEIFKEGFLNVNIPAMIEAGATTVMPVATLERYLDSTITDSLGSGNAASIALITLEPDTLSVIGAGGPTACQIVCEVRDALGNAVDSLHTTQVNFSLQLSPEGGEHIYPASLVTGSDGRVATTLYSGTIAGIVIVRAEIEGVAYSTVLPNIVIYQTGAPASITLIDLQYDSIAVHGSGSNESSTMTFEVRDAGGSPISFSQPALVNFNITGGPGGGEYLFPTSGTTNAQGQVSTTLNSGTVSGVVQVQARLEEDSTVTCSPIPLVIHSGLPDATHFAVVPRYINFPGFNYYGVVDTMTAMVGDMYGNPVPMGTAVYFTADAGIIKGSASTDPSGFASLRLFSGPPSPSPDFPFGTVFAQTIGQGGQILTDSTLVLFSGITQLYDLSPTTFTVDSAGSQIFSFRVSDQNGYPLAHGSQIMVAATAGGLIGDVNILFPDTQSQSWTYFEFVLYDDDTGEEEPPVVTAVSIVVQSPNGDVSVLISGTLD